MATTNDLKNGMTLDLEGQLWNVVEFQHVKPGKGPAFVRTKLKHVLSGKVVDKTFNAGLKIDTATVDKRTMQYLYKEGTDYHFMDNKSFEQTFIPEDGLGEAKNYLIENLNASVLFFNGKAITVSVPNSVDLKVIKCDPGVRGDTVSGALKPATLQTGYTLQVPLFINEGDVLKIDTRSGEYLTRTAVA